MCTLTFVPKSADDFILTSNRDEAPGRDTLLPEKYLEKGIQLLYPKDARAGGTWIGLSERKRLICLLNGGFTVHTRKENYKMSRGVIVTDLLAAQDALAGIRAFDFNGVEPFTLLMIEWQQGLQIYELVWDESRTYFSEKPLAPQIWSSSLLYSEAVKRKRQQWFSDFILEHPDPSEAALLKFHKTAGDGDKANDVIMDRTFIRTKSITQVVKERKVSMYYEDLQKQINVKKFIKIN
jgi:hypothetical protein